VTVIPSRGYRFAEQIATAVPRGTRTPRNGRAPHRRAQDFEALQEPPAEPLVAVICQFPDIEPPENEPV
jgi:hypothetical protein